MQQNLEKEVARFRQMAVTELRARYAELFGEPTGVTNKGWLCKRLAWRLQARAEGDLSERARRRASELACDADLRLLPPRQPHAQSLEPSKALAVMMAQDRPDPRLPPPGTMLVRKYRSESLQVKILPEGFEYQGESYPSLSAVAKAITGSHCNGFLFFRLSAPGGDR
jgi:Protein of unknown function (DUF2924)